MTRFSLITPPDVSRTLADRIRELRLAKNWKQKTLAERSGVSEGSLKRFEQTGRISLESFLQLAFTLGRLDEFNELLKPPPARSMKELEEMERKKVRKRGSA